MPPRPPRPPRPLGGGPPGPPPGAPRPGAPPPPGRPRPPAPGGPPRPRTPGPAGSAGSAELAGGLPGHHRRVGPRHARHAGTPPPGAGPGRPAAAAARTGCVRRHRARRTRLAHALGRGERVVARRGVPGRRGPGTATRQAAGRAGTRAAGRAAPARCPGASPVRAAPAAADRVRGARLAAGPATGRFRLRGAGRRSGRGSAGAAGATGSAVGRRRGRRRSRCGLDGDRAPVRSARRSGRGGAGGTVGGRSHRVLRPEPSWPVFLAGGGSLASFSLSRLSTGASTVEEAERTNSPMSFSMLRTVLLSTPSSFASS